MKQILIIALLTQFISAATHEQVEQYLSISNAEELLILESQFSAMQNGFSQDNNASDNETYDMQMLSLRFKKYIQTHLSENEMTEVLQSYKNVVFLHYISAKTHNGSIENNETENYINRLEDNPEGGVRIELVEKINSEINNKESMVVMFDELMKPLMQNAKGGDKLNDEYMKQRREAYMKSMIKSSKNETLYATKDFSIEELEKLLEVSQTPAIGYEMKAIYGATAYALKEFFLSMASRYDISKH